MTQKIDKAWIALFRAEDDHPQYLELCDLALIGLAVRDMDGELAIRIAKALDPVVGATRYTTDLALKALSAINVDVIAADAVKEE